MPAIVLAFCLVACGQNAPDSVEDRAQQDTASKAAKVEENIPETTQEIEPVYPHLTNDNVVKFLTEYGKEHTETKIRVKTRFGDMLVRLYEDTPLHRANFLYLIERDYFEEVEMTRVVKGFVAQGGNSDDPRPAMKRNLIGSYTLPPEFSYNRLHKKGALSLSRVYGEANPEKRSSPYDFFFSDGAVPGTMGIYEAEQNRGRRYTDSQVDVYKAVGGNIHLDQEHTVFGEVVSGISVLNKMMEVPVDGSDWPKEPLKISVEVVE